MKEACGCADGRQAELHSKLESATHREEYRRLASRGNVKKREKVSEKAYARLVFPCVSCIYVKTKHVQISWETEIRSKMLKKTARRPKRGALLSLSGCVYFPKGTVWNAREDKKLHVFTGKGIVSGWKTAHKGLSCWTSLRLKQHINLLKN